uniref:Uncharacterized protein n=1 Tax=Caenorhabditis tropicalis TaxID=1561998 RepID=A0A1I7U1G3_9PELO
MDHSALFQAVRIVSEAECYDHQRHVTAKRIGYRLDKWAVPRCRRWGNPMGQRPDGGGEATSGRGEQEAGDAATTTTTTKGSATRRRHKERKKLQKNEYKAPTECVEIDKGRRKRRIIKVYQQESVSRTQFSSLQRTEGEQVGFARIYKEGDGSEEEEQYLLDI